jgi:hypothetical protein
MELYLYFPSLPGWHARDNSTIPSFVFISYVIIPSHAPLHPTCQSLYSLLNWTSYCCHFCRREYSPYRDYFDCCTTVSRTQLIKLQVYTKRRYYFSLHHSDVLLIRLALQFNSHGGKSQVSAIWN